MTVITNIFCPDCDSVLDISRISIKKNLNVYNTPSSVSEENPDNNNKQEQETEDVTTQAYYICKYCFWSQKIKPGTQIMTKINSNGETSYLNLNKHKNKINSNILPFTRNFICPNKNCEGNKVKEKHEAVMFRVNRTMQMMYICCACEEIFVGQ